MPAVGLENIWQIQSIGNYLEQEVRQVWHFRQTNAPLVPSAREVTDAFELNVLTPILQVLSSAITYTAIDTLLIGSDTEFDLKPINLIGQEVDVSEDLPSWVAVQARLNRSTRDVRNGFKRFAGLKENHINGNTITSAYLASLNANKPAVDFTTIGVAADLRMCVLGRRYSDTEPPELLPPAAWEYTDVASFQWFATVSSQRSRFPGTGI